MSTRSAIPKPEHPRPDWRRERWLNLNGEWSFRFDDEDAGRAQGWQEGLPGDAELRRITVPFSWASPLSGIGDNRKGVGWYGRSVVYGELGDGEKLWLHFGAVDYRCEAWVNGAAVGSHAGGYGAFAFDVTDAWRPGEANAIVVRAEDRDESFQTRGKQGYGEIRGIWQTVWLEVRAASYVDSVRLLTALDGTVSVSGVVQAASGGEAVLTFAFAEGGVSERVALELQAGSNAFRAELKVKEPRLWSPDDPFLYEGAIRLETPGAAEADVVHTYFGIREIAAELVDGRTYRRITLNGKPVYLNGTLDQAFYPEGFFTAPSDEELQDEIWRLKRLGLNLVRIHIKPEEPRKLYWADKLGILVMEDMPCFWGEPDAAARSAYEAEAREIVARDFNHPAIISWVIFNESWGLLSNVDGEKVYTEDTQRFVRDTYRRFKAEDPSRLIEDNSPCRYDHVESDLNTWHFYLNGYEVLRDHVQRVVDETYPGSAFNYIGGNTQTDAPLMNSECGAVWGVDGSAGDSDLAWHYRYMMNEFRRHDKMCGFVFTELHDVVNEYNGYYRIDGSDKEFGYDVFVPGMAIADLHAPDFVVIDAPPCRTVAVGEEVSVPLLRSSYSDRYHGCELRLEWELAYDRFGERIVDSYGSFKAEWTGYGVAPLRSLAVRMPAWDAVAVLAATLRDEAGAVVTRNFVCFDVRSGEQRGRYPLEGGWLSVPVGAYARQMWTYSWSALDGHKVNGGPEGWIEYDVALPAEALNGGAGAGFGASSREGSAPGGNGGAAGAAASAAVGASGDAAASTAAAVSGDAAVSAAAGASGDAAVPTGRARTAAIGHMQLVFEAGAKLVLPKDMGRLNASAIDLDYMHGDTPDPGLNPNTYYMTDERKHPSQLVVSIDGEQVSRVTLPDDPADSRGVLSWHCQQNDRKLEEAGSYGYLQTVTIPSRLIPRILRQGRFTLRLEVPGGQGDYDGGLALYGRNAGRCPIDLLVRYW